MSQGERPQSEVGRGVRNAAEHELDRMNGLVHHYVAHVELKKQYLGFLLCFSLKFKQIQISCHLIASRKNILILKKFKFFFEII